MSDDQNSGDRTEEPTARRLADARKRGEVSKSREVAATAGLLTALAIGTIALGWASNQFAGLVEMAIASIDKPFDQASAELARACAWTLVSIVLAVALPMGLVAMLADFLQIGPVFSGEPLSLKFERLDLVKGLKRMFSSDGLVELVKSLLKTLLLGTIAWLVVREMMARTGWFADSDPQAFGQALRVSTTQLLAWTVAIFSVVTVADVLYQSYSFRKRMRMTRSEVQREHKEDEGDPYIKRRRRELHQEWSERNALSAAQRANVIVMNPTHVAIALDYDPETTPVPVVSAKGEDALALAMRDSARDAGVPVLQDIGLARALLARAEIGIAVPDDLFDAVAQAIVWARSMRERAPKATAPADSPTASSVPAAPESSREPAAQASSREPATRDAKASRPEERAAPRAPRPPPGNPDSTRR
jgi:type III secretion protein U